MFRKRTDKATIGQLRVLLQQRFPRWEPSALAGLATAIPGIDQPLGGGLPRGAITEVVEARAGAGGQLLLVALLEAVRKRHRFLALVDAMDGFDPQSTELDLLRHLLWVRGSGVDPALRAADLLARDTNMAALVLDLRDAPEGALRRIPSTLWFRFQRVVEMTEMALVVMTPHPLVASARIRLELDQPLSLEALECPRMDLQARLTPTLHRQRHAEEAVG